jgi:hypothetical protein
MTIAMVVLITFIIVADVCILSKKYMRECNYKLVPEVNETDLELLHFDIPNPPQLEKDRCDAALKYNVDAYIDFFLLTSYLNRNDILDLLHDDVGVVKANSDKSRSVLKCAIQLINKPSRQTSSPSFKGYNISKIILINALNGWLFAKNVASAYDNDPHRDKMSRSLLELIKSYHGTDRVTPTKTHSDPVHYIYYKLFLKIINNTTLPSNEDFEIVQPWLDVRPYGAITYKNFNETEKLPNAHEYPSYSTTILQSDSQTQYVDFFDGEYIYTPRP